MKTPQEEYYRWLTLPTLPGDLQKELENIAQDKAAIQDRFYQELEFGTGGLRGVLGAGSNRMNICTVGKATQGLANYLNGLPGKGKSVAIAHDSRINSRLFAEHAAQILAANGIIAHLYPHLEPTPALSYGVRALNCDAGVCITASHNPAQYNGYKVYGPDGCQITVQAAKAIQEAINQVDCFKDVKIISKEEARQTGCLLDIPETILDGFIQAVYDQRMPLSDALPPLKVVYTPLNGAGLECVQRILKKTGVKDVILVPEQAQPDGNFPTCPYPNPEIREALEPGLQLCKQVNPDLLLATDPDCDRVGIAVKDGNDYTLLTGNEVGILLLDFVCKTRRAAGIMPKNPVAVTTIVSSAMAGAVAKKYGLELRRTLTGFKFIGEQIGLLEQKGEIERYIFGFEESYGYLSGSHVRDKDGVNATMLICQMTQWYKSQGMTLAQAMEALYEEFGYYQNSLYSITFEGQTGIDKMKKLMADLRNNHLSDISHLKVQAVIDYQQKVGSLPRSDVLEFQLEKEAKVILRPSGTEPKLKLYLFSRGATLQEAKTQLDQLKTGMEKYLE